MRKIYSLPFNMLAIFVLYGLLSITTITLAQDGCESSHSTYKFLTMGYINLFDNPNLNKINPENIRWELYDYINVIAYPIGPDSTSYSFRKPADTFLAPIKKLVDTKKTKKAKTKILLSIRNYDPDAWPISDDGDDEQVYGKIVTETLDTLTLWNLDGVDIEYPGMRGIYCSDWNNDKEKNDGDFKGFLKTLKGKIKEKEIMLTVGKDTVPGLNGLIDYLNIETYHHSLYANLMTPPAPPTPPNQNPDITSYPNAPYTEFENAYNKWIGIGTDAKIIMGVDFGNTFQVVNNPDIAKNPSVITEALDLQPGDALATNFKKINNLCPDSPNPHLYSIPWKYLSTSALGCNETKDDWNYKYDDTSSTPWLYKELDPNLFHFVSYEDFKSLGKKLDFANSKIEGTGGIGKFVGISISDVSYDDDTSSLSRFVHGSLLPAPGNEPSSGKTGKIEPPSTATPPVVNSNQDNLKTGAKVGTIIGAVIGSLIGLVAIVGVFFLWHRNRDRPKSSSSLKSLLNFKGLPSSFRNHTTSRNTEMASDPSPNRFAVPPTTVIPVASGYVTAMFDFTGKEENDLSFKKGDKIEVLERGDGPNDWWVGRVNGAVGEFPGNYVKDT